ncbi:hypothetical protein [Dechloromonas sp. ZS-1]|uniref:hypothetical protein n=1 Tax=Dechloromonas sp. ZS-1 TaxID=3138067 RepID=UPI0031FE2D86
MGGNVERIVALAEGRIQPTTGMEAHFIRVVNGDAMPASQEEAEWFRVYQDWKRQGNVSVPDATDELKRQLRLLESREAALLSELEQKNELLEATELSNRELSSTLSCVRKELLAMREKWLAEISRANECDSKAKIATAKSLELSEALEQRIQSLIDTRHREIESEISRVVEKNQHLASLIVELSQKIRKEHTKRIKRRPPVFSSNGL